jgi:hypothetical protein
MGNRTDIILGDDGDVYAVDGDFVVSESDNQHVEHVLIAMPGEYKQYPLIGVGISQLLKGKLTGDTKRSIDLGLNNDGYSANEIKIENDKLIIDV